VARRRGLSAKALLLGAAPVSEKRVGLSRRAGAQGYGRLMAPDRLETFAIEAFRPAGTIRDASLVAPSCWQGLDLTGWAGRLQPNRAPGPSVGNPIFEAVRLRAEQTSWWAHDVSGMGRQTSGRAMQSITTMMPVRQCGHWRNDCPVITSQRSR
jgi:hypothetical protein